MKKMVCEICGGSNFRKENDSFICKDCGMEYSLEAAKKLLIEVENTNNTQNETQIKKNEESNLVEINSYLKEKLVLWAKIISSLQKYQTLFSFKDYDDPDLYNHPFDHVDWKFDRDQHSLFMNEHVVLKHPHPYRVLYYYRLQKCEKEIRDAEVSRNETMLKNRKEWYERLKKYSINYFEDSPMDIFVDVRYGFIIKEVKNLIENKFLFEEFDKMAITDKTLNVLDSIIQNRDLLPLKRHFDIQNPNLLFNGAANDKNINVFSLENFGESSAISYWEWIRNLYIAYTKYLDDGQDIKIIRKKEGIFKSKEIEYEVPVNLNEVAKKAYDAVNDIVNAFDACYNIFYDTFMTNTKNDVEKIMDEVKILEKEMMLPYQYRNLEIIMVMIRILDSGKATNWKELAIETDTSVFRDQVAKELDNVNKNLQQIDRTIRDGFIMITSILQGIGGALLSIGESIDKTNNSVNEFLQEFKDTF